MRRACPKQLVQSDGEISDLNINNDTVSISVFWPDFDSRKNDFSKIEIEAVKFIGNPFQSFLIKICKTCLSSLGRCLLTLCCIDLNGLGEPQLHLEGFRLWLFGREFPEADDYWDGNWLNIVACCMVDDAVVVTKGPILHFSELHAWSLKCEQMNATLSGEADLDCMEPNLQLKLQMKERGRCEFEVKTYSEAPRHIHSFLFDIDQSYLPSITQSLKALFIAYPLKKP